MRTDPEAVRARHLEEALHLAEERFLATFELAPVGIAHIAPDGRWLRVNQRLCEILGYGCEELLGLRFQDLTHPEDLAADLDQALRTLAGEQAEYRLEKRYVRKDGSSVWAEVRVALVREKATEKPLFFVAVIDDISEQRRAEQALERHATELRTLLERLPDIVTRFDLAARHLYVNPAVQRATGRPASEFLGRTNRELGMPAPLVEQWEQIHHEVVEHGEPREIDFVFPSPDGPRRFWTRMVPERDESGRVVGVLSVARDLTRADRLGLELESALLEQVHARVLAEARLAEGEQRLRFLAELIPHLVWSTLPDGYHDYYNQRWFDYTGLTYEDTKGPGWNDVLHPDDRERAWKAWRHSLETGEPYAIEYRFRRHDGAYRWFLGRAMPLRREDGAIERWFGTCTDIQALKDAEAALRASEERLQAALDASATGTFRWDMRTGDLNWDLASDRLFGLPEGQTPRSEEAFLAQVHPEDRPRVNAAIEQCLSVGGHFRAEFRIVWPDGTERWVLDKARMYLDDDGRPLYMTGACVDITERKVAELEKEELLQSARAARAEAEAANQLKSQFLANMSHEIRTPINALIGYADLLELGVHGGLEPEQRHYLRRITASSQHLLTLVNDVLDLAKVEAGGIEVMRKPLPIRPVVFGALEITDALIAAQSLTLFDETVCDEAGWVWGDADRIRQILVNLIANATKFTEAGGEIRLRCRVSAATPEGVRSDWEGPWLGVEVEDTGIGVAPEMQERIFAPFSQVDGGRTRRRGGTGLGLTISRGLARLMAGDVVVRSAQGEGSCFTLWLPAVEDQEGGGGALERHSEVDRSA